MNVGYVLLGLVMVRPIFHEKWDEKCRGGFNSEPNKGLRFTTPLASQGTGIGIGL